MLSFGPVRTAAAEKTAVPVGAGGGSAPAATRAPQRAQKTSTPGTTALPQEPHTKVFDFGAGDGSATRPPHFGQKGRVGSTGVWQYRQGVFIPAPPPLPAFGFTDTRVSGTAKGRSAPPCVAAAGTGMMRAPLATTGLPQSRQNLDAGSFSRPQDAQRITGTRGGLDGSGRIYGWTAGEGRGVLRQFAPSV